MPKDKDNSRRPPAGRARRSLKLGAMGVSLAGRFAGGKVRDLITGKDENRSSEHHEQMGRLVAETLGELKGAVMKVGQIASQVSDLLPAEVSEQLRILQKQAPPMDYAVISDQIERSLGKPPDALFASFDKEALAAASIGQVHAATLEDGSDVVVKIQYPGVRDSCDADLAQLKTAMQLGRLMKVSGKALNRVFAEIRERIHEELDYEAEASNLIEFRNRHADLKWLTIPEPVQHLCSNEVLTMTRHAGDPLGELGELDYSEASINLISERLIEMMVRQLFDFHCIHADPHPGNFACDRDGNITLFDFGCVKRLSPASVQAYRDTVIAGLAGDCAGIDAGLIALGARIIGKPALPDEEYLHWREILMRPLLTNSTYDFGTSTQHQDAVLYLPQAMKYMDRLQPPSETMYVDRLVTGHYWNLVHLGARINVRQILDPYLAGGPALS